MAGWSLIGFSSALLIGAYNERVTSRTNATFVFAVYQLSDCLMLVAAALSGSEAGALALVMGALVKTSQLPFTNLFARAMEGASPSSALAYGALCAHSGVVILSLFEALWSPVTSCRVCLALVGALTALVSGLVANVRADRKGALAHATSGTVGLLYVILALGYTDAALVLAMAHAVLRTFQILRAHNSMLEAHQMKGDLGAGKQKMVQGMRVSSAFYSLAWRCNRFSADMRLPTLGAGMRHQVPCDMYHITCDMQYVLCDRKFQTVTFLVLLLEIGYTCDSPKGNRIRNITRPLRPRHLL